MKVYVLYIYLYSLISAYEEDDANSILGVASSLEKANSLVDEFISKAKRNYGTIKEDKTRKNDCRFFEAKAFNGDIWGIDIIIKEVTIDQLI